MIESFVDLTYRGLSLGRRVRLTDVRPTLGYLEMPSPMPVGTAISIISDDTVALDAIVVEIREQVAGADRPPGMVVRPKLDGEAEKTWWKQRVVLPEAAKPATPPPIPAPPVVPSAPVVVVSKRMTHPGIGVPELLDDGQDTGVMEAVDPAVVPAGQARVQAVAPEVESVPVLVDDGKKTTAMDAVDLAALGLATSSTSGQMAAEPAADDEDFKDGNGGGDKPPERPSGRRKRRRSR